MQAIQSIELAQLHGFSNITIDLIYGTPGLTDEQWHQNVQQAIALKIPHLSCYALTVEPKTALEKMISTQKKERLTLIPKPANLSF
jgi:oxygen-independent coproporphyrinogen-3 oxidase